MRYVIFWQTMPSPHMAGLIRCLGQRADYVVSAIFSDDLASERKALGWSIGNFGSGRAYVKPSHSEIEGILSSCHADTIHIFSGINYDGFLRYWYEHLNGAGARLGVLSEGRKGRGLSGHIKLLDSHIREFPRLQKADFILAIGRVGRQWYSNRGLRPPIYDFGYVVDPISETISDNAEHAATDISNHISNIIFVGRLVALKAPDHLLKAVARFKDNHWRVQIVGAGPELPRLQRMVRTLALEPHVEFLGTMENSLTRSYMRQADVMAFPSIGDGWGAVVNESLQCGTPVVCTDYAGASDLIRHRRNGSIYACGSIAALHQELSFWRTQMREHPEIRTTVKISANTISAETMADYLVRVLDHVYTGGDGVRPIAAWRNCEHA